jgi:hypothetical protein
VTGTISYLNTDLDLVSTDDLSALVAVLDARGVFALHAGRRDDGFWYATFETAEQHGEPEPNIAAMVSVVESLDETDRATWSRCTRREFHIGYDCGTTPWAFTQTLSSALLRRVAGVDASLRVTLYPNRDRDTGTDRT